MNKKIIFATGGTGGHIFPAVNLMKHFLEKGYEVLIVTDARGQKFLKDTPNIKSYVIKAASPMNKNFFNKTLSLIIIFFAIIRSIFILKKEKPKLIFGFGGYVSFPISLASKFFKIPLIIYENNTVLGQANKYLLPFSKKILSTNQILANFPNKHKNKIYKVGYILKKNIINCKILNNNDTNLNILVLGGSQGAEIFGKVIPPVIKMMKEKGYKITVNQQCIKKQKDSITKFYEENNINNNVFEFKNNIVDLFSSANIAISRCGASSLAELTQTITPFIAVPLPNSVDNHQYLNAKFYEKMGCCWILEEKNFNLNNLFNLITEIIEDKKKLEQVKKSMKNNNNTDVYNNIENEIKEFI